MSAAHQTPFHETFAIRWTDVKDLGKVYTQRLPSGRERHRIAIRSGGREWWISRQSVGPIEVAFDSRDAAKHVLSGIRALIAQGKSIEQAIAQFTPSSSPEDLVENRLAEYLEHFRGLVAQEQRSINSLEELGRYAQESGEGSVGAFAWWRGHNVSEITPGDIEDWHKWLGKRENHSTRNKRKTLSPKTQKNISDAFRAFLNRLMAREEIDRVPKFPTIKVPGHAPRIIDVEAQVRILNAIPWERRGLFLLAATEALRVGEIFPLNVTDYRDGRIRIAKAKQGRGKNERVVGSTKTGHAEWREIWSPELLEWLERRFEFITDEDRIANVALFQNPAAKKAGKRWNHESVTYQWSKACDAVNDEVPFQEGTRHSLLTTLGASMPSQMLQAFSRHKDQKSLSHYTKPRPTRAAILRATGTSPDWGGRREGTGRKRATNVPPTILEKKDVQDQ